MKAATSEPFTALHPGSTHARTRNVSVGPARSRCRVSRYSHDHRASDCGAGARLTKNQGAIDWESSALSSDPRFIWPYCLMTHTLLAFDPQKPAGLLSVEPWILVS